MNRDIPLQVLRGTKANLETAKSAGQLLVGEPYLLTDTGCLAIGTATNAYTECAASNVANTFTALQTFGAGVRETGVATATNTGAAYTINLANGSLFNLVLNTNCTFTLPTPTFGLQFTLFLKPTSTYTYTFSPTVQWDNGSTTPPVLTANKTAVLSFIANGASWVGFANATGCTL